MRTFTQFNESCLTADINPGNSAKLGVANHYTPIENIVTNVKNLFATRLGVVCTTGEDNVSIKLHSTKFINKEEINKVLCNPLFNDNLSLRDYIIQQGLDLIKMINVGQYWVVYFCPRDIVVQDPLKNPGCGDMAPEAPCEEMKEALVSELEMCNIFEDDDEELQDVTKLKIQVLLNSKDKVKAAKALEELISKEMTLPREFYFAGVKSKSGEESIALRWRYNTPRPHGKSDEQTRSLINIFGPGNEGIWVSDYAEDSMFKLPDDVKEIVDAILEIIGAESTENPAIFNIIPEEEKAQSKDDSTEDDKNEDDDLLDSDGKEKKEDEDEEVEDDDSRNEDNDGLL